MEKQQITFEEFLEIEKKLDIRIGQIISAERIQKSKKLLKLIVVFGEEENEIKTVVTNLGEKFDPERFIGVACPFIMNLVPSTMMGVTSEAMIMVAESMTDGNIDLDNYSIGSKLL